MQYRVGNIWDFVSHGWIVVTTNTTIRRDGLATMGAGIAKEAADREPMLPKLLAAHVHQRDMDLFFKKPFICLATKQNWRNPSRIEWIERGCHQLVSFGDLLDQLGNKDEIFLPKLGCGLGGLNWEREVRPVVDSILNSDRFILVSRDE